MKYSQLPRQKTEHGMNVRHAVLERNILELLSYQTLHQDW